jgi:hypothetical protein
MTGPPTSTRAQWNRELESWAKALAWSLPLIVVAWIFVFPKLPAPLFHFAPALGLATFLVIGFLSRSSLWALIVWLLPWSVVTLASIAGAHGTLFAVFTVCAFAYSAVLMMYDWPYRWVNLATGWLWRALAEAGLSRREREVHRRLRRARFLTPDEHRLATQGDDRQSMAQALRAPGDRVLAIDPPDEEWANVLKAIAAPMIELSRAVERGASADYDAYVIHFTDGYTRVTVRR